MTYTPETLRALIKKLTYEGGDDLRTEGYVHAEAWEAQTAAHLDWMAEQGRMIGDYRKRLEAAEEENKAATKWAGEQGWIVEPWLRGAK